MHKTGHLLLRHCDFATRTQNKTAKIEENTIRAQGDFCERGGGELNNAQLYLI